MTPATAGQQNLLIVEDNFDDYYAIRRALIATGWRGAVHYAATGEQAWEQLTGNELPDMMLLDMRLPGMEGDELLRRMQGNAKLQSIKVVVFTGVSDPQIQQRCLELGVVDVVTKPDDLYDFVLTLRDVLLERPVGRKALQRLRGDADPDDDQSLSVAC